MDQKESSKSAKDCLNDSQVVERDGKCFRTIREGLAHILIPEAAKLSQDPKQGKLEDTQAQAVFYNPIQQFNRDLSVLAVQAYGEDLIAVRQHKFNSRIARGRKRKRKTVDVDDRISNKDENLNIQQNVQQEQAHETNGNDEPEKSNVTKQTTPADAVMIEGAENGQIIRAIDPMSLAKDHASNLDGHQAGEPPAPSLVPHRGRFKILDALSATGLRALRYAQEIPFVTSVTANDLSIEATRSIKANMIYNKLEDKIEIVTGNAMSHMYSLLSNPSEPSKQAKYDVIDLDPYGTAVPFLDGAMHAVADGGLLCVTCTDAALWASCGYPEKTYSLYGGTPIRGLHSHEGGLRLILHAIASSAARYGMSIEPLLSLSIDFYARVFVRVFQSPAEVKILPSKTMLVHNCDSGCGAWSTQFLVRMQTLGTKNGQTSYKHSLAQGPTASALCAHCGTKTHISGPMYGGPIHNTAFIQSILDRLPALDTSVYQTVKRLEGMLTTALEESMLDDEPPKEACNGTEKAQVERPVPRADPMKVDQQPFFFIPSALAKILHTRAPSEAELKGALKHAGYRVTRSHAKPGTIKTNAPWSFLWRMMREWVRQKAPIKDGAIKVGTPGWGIMQGGQSSKQDGEHATPQIGCDEGGRTPNNTDDPAHAQQAIVFDEALGKEVNKRRLARYQENPRSNWGPMSRAKRDASTTTGG